MTGDHPVPLDHQEMMEFQEPLVLVEEMVDPVLLDPLVLKETKENVEREEALDLLAQLVQPVTQVLQDLMDKQVLLDNQDKTDVMEHVEIMEMLVQQDPLAQLVHQVPLVCLAQLVVLVHLVLPDKRVTVVKQETLVQLVLPERGDPLEQLDLLETEERRETKETRVSPAVLDHLVWLEREELQESVDKVELLVPQDHPAGPVSRVPVETPVNLEQMDHQGHLEHLVAVVTTETRDTLDLVDCRDPQDLPDIVKDVLSAALIRNTLECLPTPKLLTVLLRTQLPLAGISHSSLARTVSRSLLANLTSLILMVEVSTTLLKCLVRTSTTTGSHALNHLKLKWNANRLNLTNLAEIACSLMDSKENPVINSSAWL